MNKLTLIVDTNWLLISRMSVLMKGFSNDNTDVVKESTQLELEELMAKSLNVILNRFPVIDNVVLVADGGSWRKQLPIPKSLEEIKYKGNRSQTSDLDWNYIWGAQNEFLENCKKEGITVSHGWEVEGDDWVWYWSRRLNGEGVNCIIWSSDNDLKQLVQTDKATGAFTMWYNDKSGMWLPSSIEDNGDGVDWFFQVRYYSPTLEALKKHCRKIEYVDPNSIITSKVICGDSGDNIKSIFRYEKNNRVYRISEKEWEKYGSDLNIRTIEDVMNGKNRIVESICSSKKYSPYHPMKEELEEMIDYNIKLVWLNESVIPDTIIQFMNQQEYKMFDIPYFKSNYKILIRSNDMIEDIFNSI